jgi:hypothetical protein
MSLKGLETSTPIRFDFRKLRDPLGNTPAEHILDDTLFGSKNQGR